MTRKSIIGRPLWVFIFAVYAFVVAGCEQDHFINDHVTGTIVVSDPADLDAVRVGLFKKDFWGGTPYWLEDVEQFEVFCDDIICGNQAPIQEISLDRSDGRISYRVNLPEPRVVSEEYILVAWLDVNDDGLLYIVSEQMIDSGAPVETNRLPLWTSDEWVEALHWDNNDWVVDYLGNAGALSGSTNTTHADGWNFYF